MKLYESDLKDGYSTIFAKVWPTTAKELLEIFNQPKTRKTKNFTDLPITYQSRLEIVLEKKEGKND